jgi:hypothetical protein
MKIIIRIRINLHQLSFDRPVSALSKSQLKGLPTRLPPFGLFRITFGILMFILLHVVANLIFIFLVSRQLVMLLNVPKFNFFVVRKGVPYSSEKFNLD